jgi:hypothetical protein
MNNTYQRKKAAMEEDAKELFREGVYAIDENNDIIRGRRLLVESLRLDPHNDVAWLWLARTVLDRNKQRDCLNRALKVNPSNAQAHMLLEQLDNGVSIAIGKMTPKSPADAYATKEVPRTPARARPGRRELGTLVIADQVSFWSQAPKLLLVLLLVGWIAVSLNAFLNTTDGPGTLPALVIFIGIPLAAALYMIYSFIRGRQRRVEIYQGGIALVTGGKRKSWLWDDFAALRLTQSVIRTQYRVYGVVPAGSSTSTRFQAIFLDGRGKRLLRLGKSYPNYFKIGQAIVQGLGPVLLERDLEAFQRGETLRYDDMRVDRKGIHRKGMFSTSSIVWDDIQQWDFKNGALVIKKRSGKQSVLPINGVTNGFVLIMLLGTTLTGRQGEGR